MKNQVYQSLEKLNLPDDIKKLSIKELDILAEDVRKKIIDIVSKTGGHLAPSLGVVELTIAILRIANMKQDKIIWDVGHQTYAYKILTDRLDRFHTLRQYKGLSGFTSPTESKYDTTISGHASVSISTGLGVHIANEFDKKNAKTFVVIGDGAMSGGVAFEALNNVGMLQKNLIIILNDNEMSIDHNVGAFSSYLSRTLTSEFVTKLKKDIENIVEDAPLGDKFLSFAKKVETSIVSFFTPGSVFEELGIKYIGPINGHKVKDLEKALKNALGQKAPVLIHVATKKGKGYQFAEDKPNLYHGVSAFNIDEGVSVDSDDICSWSKVFANKLTKLAKKDKRIVAITAAMKEGTGLSCFAKQYPNRFFDVGIAEQHAVAFAGGLASNGYKPFFAVYSTFLQRAYDQIIHDVAIANLPVVFAVDRAGIVGNDGPTHHGVYDISFLNVIPNITIMMPKDGFDLEQMVELSTTLKSPVVIRYPRGNTSTYDELPKNNVELGKAELIFKGSKLAIVTAGHIFDEGYKLYNKVIAEKLYKKSDIALINLRFMKPLMLSKELLHIFEKADKIITIEESAKIGGVGSYLQNILIEKGVIKPILKFGIDDIFVAYGDLKSLRKDCKLNSDSIFNILKNEIKKNR